MNHDNSMHVYTNHAFMKVRIDVVIDILGLSFDYKLRNPILAFKGQHQVLCKDLIYLPFFLYIFMDQHYSNPWFRVSWVLKMEPISHIVAY